MKNKKEVDKTSKAEPKKMSGAPNLNPAANDSVVVFNDLKNEIRHFCEEREWDVFHSAKDLSIGLVTEASELLEIFRFKAHEESEALLKTKSRNNIEEELADALFFVLRFAQKYDIDLTTAFRQKMESNRKKYPVEKAKGSNRKYSEL